MRRGGNRPRPGFPLGVVSAHGEPRTYISLKFPLFDAGGAPYAVAGISTDITGRKKTEEHLRETALRDEESNLLGFARVLREGWDERDHASEVRVAQQAIELSPPIIAESPAMLRTCAEASDLTGIFSTSL